MAIETNDFVQDSIKGKRAIILLGHGSRKENSSDLLYKMANILKKDFPDVHISVSFMSLCSPAFESSVQKLVEEGTKHITILSCFLFKGIHITKDIPEMIENLKNIYPDVMFFMTDTLGEPLMLCRIAKNRLLKISRNKFHCVYLVGAGPGNPELITLKGKNIIEQSDVLIYPGSLIDPSMLGWVKPEVMLIDSAPLTLEAIVEKIENSFNAGLNVTRLHSGDPTLYSALGELTFRLDTLNIPYEVIPGVSSVFAASARLKRELTLPDISQSIVLTRISGRTKVPQAENLAHFAKSGATIALYLSIGLIKETIKALLEGFTKDTPAIIAYRVSWPDERIIVGTLGTIEDKLKTSGIKRHALILVGKVFKDVSNAYVRSKLYDPSFRHTFRPKTG